MKNLARNLRLTFRIILCISFILSVALEVSATRDPIKELLADHPVVVLTDEPELIDWPLILELCESGSSVDIVTVGEGLRFRLHIDSARFHSIRLIRAVLPTKSQTRSLDSLVRLLRAGGSPRTVFLPRNASSWIDSVQSRLRASDSLLQRAALYRLADSLGGSDMVVVNARHLASQHESDYALISADFGLPEMADYPSYHFYQQLTTERVTSFLDIHRWRVQNYLTDGANAGNSAIQDSLSSLLTRLEQSIERPSRLRAEGLLAAQSSFRKLAGMIANSKELMADRGMRGYLAARDEAFRRAVLTELQVRMDATLSEEITPMDTSLVYRLAINNEGALPIQLTSIELGSSKSSHSLESVIQIIPPHGRLLRQFLIPDSISSEGGLRLSARLIAGSEELIVESSRTRERAGSLTISFDPPFLFVPPVARITDDKTAASHDWRIRINKDAATSGKAKLLFEPPRGLFAGAYRQEISLEADLTTDWVSIPFSVTNLFELGAQTATIQLLRGGKVVDVDTGRIRIAECLIEKDGSIGFVPDTSGHLEDLLRMTSATYEPLTDRTLTAGNLEAFRTIIIGSAANWRSPQVANVRSRLEEFLRAGGVIVLFGQPSDWPSNALPLPFSPQPLRMSGSQALVRQSDHRLLTTPYVISTDILLKDGPRERYVQATLGGANVVITAPTDQALLAVAPYGGGKIVYCGLPLLEMVARLNIEAIHLFANLLNY